MKPFIQIALTSGQVYEIPTQVIAANRAKVMLDSHKDEFPDLEAAMTDTVELFDDNYEVRDWALNNMNPEDYMPSARMVRFVPPEQDFNTAEWSHHDAPAIVGELDGEQIMRQPLEAVFSTMASANQICSVTVISGPDGKPFAGVGVFIGSEAIVNTYARGLATVTQHLTAKPAEIPTH